MTNANTPEPSQDKEPATEAERQSIDGKAGQSSKSSHDNKSHTKAGQDTGAGGGKKRERHH